MRYVRFYIVALASLVGVLLIPALPFLLVVLQVLPPAWLIPRPTFVRPALDVLVLVGLPFLFATRWWSAAPRRAWMMTLASAVVLYGIRWASVSGVMALTPSDESAPGPLPYVALGAYYLLFPAAITFVSWAACRLMLPDDAPPLQPESLPVADPGADAPIDSAVHDEGAPLTPGTVVRLCSEHPRTYSDGTIRLEWEFDDDHLLGKTGTVTEVEGDGTFRLDIDPRGGWFAPTWVEVLD